MGSAEETHAKSAMEYGFFEGINRPGELIAEKISSTEEYDAE